MMSIFTKMCVCAVPLKAGEGSHIFGIFTKEFVVYYYVILDYTILLTILYYIHSRLSYYHSRLFDYNIHTGGKKP